MAGGHQRATVAIAGVGIVLLMSSAVALQRVREARYPRPPVSSDTLYITSGKMLRRLTVGYHALAADVYWIRSIQYFGGIRRRWADGLEIQAADQGYPLLYPLLDLTTSLDPLFNIAYRFGAIFLAEPFPSGAGRPDLAVALLQKGLVEKPDKWEYMQDIGYVHYWWRQDYTSAAEWFDRAARVPGAPWFMKSLAAVTLAEGGNRESSRLMWQSIRETTEVEWLRNDAERRLRQLNALDFIDQLQPIVDRAAASLGGVPEGWAPLIQRRMIPGEPRDPSGTPYEIDEAGRVRVSATSPLFPLPTEPKRIANIPIPQ